MNNQLRVFRSNHDTTRLLLKKCEELSLNPKGDVSKLLRDSVIIICHMSKKEIESQKAYISAVHGHEFEVL